jgi:hypothetical protein
MILILFVCVALFGALSYAFLYGSRTSLSWIEGERDKATATGTQDCANTIALATKRLEMRGCGPLISSLPDGSNTNAGAPQDGSCSIYHPNGGGAKNCLNLAVAAPSSDPCSAANNPAPGQLCDDGTYYIKTLDGFRIFMAGADEPGTYRFKTTKTATAGGSPNAGYDATNVLIAGGAALHPAAQACRTKGPEWFLPQFAEYRDVQTLTNVPPLGNIDLNKQYWSAHNSNPMQAFFWRKGAAPAYNVQVGMIDKTNISYVRCFKREPE